jgi:hypothetical protein
MFKKVEIWVLYLSILLGLIFAICFGVLVRQELVGNTKMGSFSKSALFLAEIPVNTRKIFQSFDGLAPLENRFPDFDGFIGENNLKEMYLLLSRYDGDLKTSVVDLVDLKNFKILQSWLPNSDLMNQLASEEGKFKNLKRDNNNLRTIIGHPILANDGELIYRVAGGPIRKIDQCSKLIYQNTEDRYHHSIEIDVNENIWSPSQLLYPRRKNKVFLDDHIAKISMEGKLQYQKSVKDIFIENDMEYLLYSVGDRFFDLDPIHLNDIQPVDFDSEFWKKGDVFISLRHQSMIMLYRPSTNQVLWKDVGKYYHQHDIDILDNNRISIFNNNSKDFIDGDIVDGHNEIIIFDFKQKKYSSYLKDSLKKNDVRTITEGTHQILPNGDLFVEETNFGRTLYFNADGSLRWFHINKSSKGSIYPLGWSRILYTEKDIKKVKNFIKKKKACNE